VTGLRRLAATAFIVAAGSFAGLTETASSATTKSCPSGFVRAGLSWGVKCLHAGEFCKVGNREYGHFGFSCPATGHLQER